MCDATIQFSSTNTLLHHIKNKHQAAMSKVHFPDSWRLKMWCPLVQGDMLPISVVQGRGFKELKLVWYLMPTRATVTYCIEKYFEKKMNKLKVMVPRADKLL